MSKNVQIPEELFSEICALVLFHREDVREDVERQLKDKVERMKAREDYCAKKAYNGLLRHSDER